MNKFVFIYALTFFGTTLSISTYACENHGSSYGFFSVYNDWSMRSRHMPGESEVHVTNSGSSSDSSSDGLETNSEAKIVAEKQNLESQNMPRKTFLGSAEP